MDYCSPNTLGQSILNGVVHVSPGRSTYVQNTEAFFDGSLVSQIKCELGSQPNVEDKAWEIGVMSSSWHTLWAFASLPTNALVLIGSVAKAKGGSTVLGSLPSYYILQMITHRIFLSYDPLLVLMG